MCEPYIHPSDSVTFTDLHISARNVFYALRDLVNYHADQDTPDLPEDAKKRIEHQMKHIEALEVSILSMRTATEQEQARTNALLNTYRREVDEHLELIEASGRTLDSAHEVIKMRDANIARLLDTANELQTRTTLQQNALAQIANAVANAQEQGLI